MIALAGADDVSSEPRLPCPQLAGRTPLSTSHPHCYLWLERGHTGTTLGRGGVRGVHQGARLWDTFGLLGLRERRRRGFSLSKEHHFDLKDSVYHILKKKRKKAT